MTVLQTKNEPMVKYGANMNDRNMIAKLVAKGQNAEEISSALRIKLSCVESFIPEVDTEDEVDTGE